MDNQKELESERIMAARLNARFLMLFVSFVGMGFVSWFALWVWV